jgi:signal peptidase I
VEKVYRIAGWTVLVAAALVAILRIVAIRWWQVPSQSADPELAASIAPSLEGGDWVLSWRLTRPGKGDLVVCPDPDDPSNIVMGRIVGETGDKVSIDGQDVLLNGVKPSIEYNCTEQTFSLVDPDTTKEVQVFCDMEDIGDKLHMRAHNRLLRTTKARHFEKTVEPGRVFLLSDNRVHPFDSRHFGTVDRQSCKETVFFRLVSERGFFDHARRLNYIR